MAASLPHAALPAPAVLHAPAGRQDAIALGVTPQQKIRAGATWWLHPQQCERVHLLQSATLGAEAAEQAGHPGLQGQERCQSHQRCRACAIIALLQRLKVYTCMEINNIRKTQRLPLRI